MAAAKKWTKTDVRTLQRQLLHWWTGMALYARAGVTVEQVFDSMPATARVDVVVGGLRSFESMARERAASSRRTSEHYRGCWADTGQPRDPSGEVVERFARMAVDDDRAADKCAAMAERVLAEGLPDDVATFVPTREAALKICR